jgi:cytochrome c oxidase subunit 2
VGKGWSILFAVVLLAEFLLFVISPFIPGWWLPPDIGTFDGVDKLWNLILGFTGFFFVLTEVILVWNMWSYAEDPARKATYTHGNHRLEMMWTIVPAGILLFIAIAQIPTWAGIKYQSKFPEDPDQIAQVTARQWEWRIRHVGPHGNTFVNPPAPRAWAETAEADDVYMVNEFHTWKNAKVQFYLKTQDVIHSFFLPNIRLKQDALPGKTIPVWFSPTRSNMLYDPSTNTWFHNEEAEKKGGATFELACAELCGSRHYAMRGRLCVHRNRDDYVAWLKAALKAQRSMVPDGKAGESPKGSTEK